MKYFEDAKRQFVLLEGQIYAECNNYEKAIAVARRVLHLKLKVGLTVKQDLC